MIVILLPHAEWVVDMLKGTVDHVLIDRYNYHYADWAYKKHGMTWHWMRISSLKKARN